MINPIASEAVFSATYVDNYIDFVENLPDDVQRHLSRIRDIDVQYRSHLRDVDYYYEQWKSFPATSENSAKRRARAMARMQQSLISAQELGDEKMHIVNQQQELIDQKTRRLDSDRKNLDYGREEQQLPDLNQKNIRTLSPVPTQATTPVQTNKNEGQFVAAIVSSAIVGSGQGTGNNTPTSSLQAHERQIINYNVGVSNISNSNDSRSNKRSRRPRNENTSSSVVELGGNESNSANEGGGPSGHKTSGTGQSSSSSASASQKKASGQNVGGNCGGVVGGSNSSKKKKRKVRGHSSSQSNARDNREETPPPDPIDPDEPTYCLCDQISFGEMILCDNDLCPIEWFHFSCVSLVSKPKGKWYCPNCRGDRPNVMKPKAQFLKELERYNKEKEEKT